LQRTGDYATTRFHHLRDTTFGVALVFVNVLVQTSLQESIPHEFLSRVSSIFSLVVMGLGPVGFALCGPATNLVGTERVLEVGAGALLLSVATLLCSRSVRKFTHHCGDGLPPRL